MADRLPPGPRSAAFNVLPFMRTPFEYLASCVQRYGDPFTMPTFGGGLVITGDPEGVRAIFSADPETLGAFGKELRVPNGEHSLLVQSGAQHKAARRLLTPPLHGARMRAYGELIAGATLRHAARWPADRAFSVLDTTQAISLEVILKAVFGVVDEARGVELRDAITAATASWRPSIIFVRGLRREFGGVGPWARYRRAMGSLDAFIYREIEARRAAPVPGEDILSLMLAARYDDGAPMSDVEIRDQLYTMLSAGHETTAVSLAWAVYALHRPVNAVALKRLRAELVAAHGAAPDALAHLPYLDAVCNETLRLHPIGPVIARTLLRPMTLKGWELPPGAAVGASISLVHQRSDLYPEPTAFRPERFASRAFSPFEFLPFGGGARRCIGAAFASYEMKVVLGTMLQRWALRLESERPLAPRRRNMVMEPEGGTRVWAASRPIRATQVEVTAEHSLRGC